MRIRHKVPAIFSLSMVDMLCCALGCVILVWLLNAKQSEDEAAERRDEIAALHRQAEADRSESRRLLDEAHLEHDRATAQLRTLTSERSTLLAEIATLKKRSAGLEQSSQALEKQLIQERERSKDLTGKLRLYGERVVNLENDVRLGTTRLDEERKKVAGLSKQLNERDDTLKSARADLARREDALRNLQTELKTAQDRQRLEKERAETMARSVASTEKLRTQTEALLSEMRLARERAESALATRDKALDAARGQVASLEKLIATRQAAVQAVEAKLARAEADKRSLAAAAEARFAGIELTGKRVLFLVDTSGSMEMLDDSTEAPKKWQEVCDTVARLMRSLPQLEKFQILSFAAAISYPLGQERVWLNHDPKTTPEQARKALAAIKPKGGTNMYAALDEAFLFRKTGLDTIYVLSDGLPNQGEGLDASQQATLRGLERGLLLGKHVRTMLRTTWNAPQEGRRVRIHTIGFFYESPDLGSFLWALARENEGSFVGMSRP